MQVCVDMTEFDLRFLFSKVKLEIGNLVGVSMTPLYCIGSGSPNGVFWLIVLPEF